MLKSILISLALVGGIAAKSTTLYDYDAPDGCETSLSFESCFQPATSADSCSETNTPCSCSAEDLNRKCQLKYCPGVSYTRSLWMYDCTSLSYSYINNADGAYITAPVSAEATATATAKTATATDKSSGSTAAASSAASSASSKASAGAGSPTSGTAATSSPSGSSKPNDAGRAMGFPSGGMLAMLATVGGAIAGMLLL